VIILDSSSATKAGVLLFVRGLFLFFLVGLALAFVPEDFSCAIVVFIVVPLVAGPRVYV